MPVYEVTAPNGKTFEVNAPDEATQDQVLAYAKQQFAGMEKRREASDAELRKMADPTGSFGDNLLAGAGKFFADTARGFGQRVGLVSEDDVQEARRIDTPLMKTAGGITGNIVAGVTTLAPIALVPGANTTAGATAMGGVFGATQPFTNALESWLNPALGAAGGGGGQAVANWAGGTVAQQGAQAAKQAAANAQKVQAAQSANKAGYVIPPADLPNASMMTEAVSGLSGKIKTAQQASAKNQSVTNELAKKAIGLSAGDTLDAGALNAIRAQAGQAYDAVANSGTITPGQAYAQALDRALQPFKTAQAGFPNAKVNPVVDAIEALKSPSFDASAAVSQIKLLRESADQAYRSGDKAAGKALKSASEALEGAIDAHLVSSGAPAGMLQAFRDARQLIAKTYTVQKGMNGQTGDVSAQALAKDLAKGKPLSGDLKTIAEAGQAFPKATQALKETPKQLSPLDFGAAGLGLIGSGGNPLAALGLIARPAARSALLSTPVQQRAISRAAQAPQPSAMLNLLSYEQVNQPAGVLTGNALAAYLAQQQALER